MRFLSQVYTIARGSVGGITYTANQHHQLIARARTSPVNPSTTPQNQVRQAFSGAAVDWLAQTDAVREGWDQYADSLTYPNPLGDQSLPGRLTFMGNIGFMRYLYARGYTQATVAKTAPTTPGFLALDPVIIAAPSAPGTGVGVSVGNFNGEDINVYMWVSRIFAPTRNTYKGPWVSNSLIELPVADQSTGVHDFIYGSDGDIIFVYIRAIVDDGSKRVSEPVILRGVVDTTVV